MRRSLVVLLALASAPAVASPPPMRPLLSSACPGGAEWSSVAACFARHGWKPSIASPLPDVKIVDLGVLPPADVFAFDAGLLIYLRTSSGWSVGGHWSVSGRSYAVLDAKRLDQVRPLGVRVDIGSRDDRGGITLAKSILVCDGGPHGCVEVTQDCDQIVDGHVVAAFHGALVVDNRTVHVAGDRRLATGRCAFNGDSALGFP